MGNFAELSGVRIVSGSIAIPKYGMWSGDVALATTDPVPSDVSLVLGNLTMAGHVYRQAAFGGARSCRLVAGAGGWNQEVPFKQYALAGGVNASLLLSDAALEVGEKVNVPDDRSVGVGWVRQRGPASRVLRRIATTWYTDAQGVTQIKEWPTTVVRTPFTVEDQNGGGGQVTIATEDYAAWMPGATFKGPTLDETFTVCGVLYKFSGDGTFRLEVLTQ